MAYYLIEMDMNEMPFKEIRWCGGKNSVKKTASKEADTLPSQICSILPNTTQYYPILPNTTPDTTPSFD